MKAKKEWMEFDARRPLRMVKEQASGEELDNESVSTEGELFDGCYFSHEDFAWKAQIKEARPFNFAAAREGSKTKIEDGIKELQAAVEDLSHPF
jgi:hypothetical protein